MIHPVRCSNKIIVIGQEWPCWLTSVLALKLPLLEAYISQEFRDIFETPAYVPLRSFGNIWDVSPDWNSCTVLTSGSHEYLSHVLTKLRYHEGPFIHATDFVVKGWGRQDVECLYGVRASLREEQGLCSRVVLHAEFGGVTSSIHLISYQGVDDVVFNAPPALPRVLAHILDSASPDKAQEIVATQQLPAAATRSPIVLDGLLRQEGLFDLFRPDLRVACPCVFKGTAWATLPLSATEFLRVFDSPLDMDPTLLNPHRERRMRSVLPRGITPLIMLAVFCSMWSTNSEGVAMEATAVWQGLTSNKKMCKEDQVGTPSKEEKEDQGGAHSDSRKRDKRGISLEEAREN